eukprot:COSAG04_NODE_11699_length_693_cov_1.324916_2_plen_74_part_00
MEAKKLEHTRTLATRRAEIHRHKQSVGSKVLLWMHHHISGFGFVGVLGCKSRCLSCTRRRHVLTCTMIYGPQM